MNITVFYARALFVYTDDNHITHAESGETYSDFLAKLTGRLCT